MFEFRYFQMIKTRTSKVEEVTDWVKYVQMLAGENFIIGYIT